MEMNKEEKHNWKEEWKDMPEFIQEKQKPFSKIIFRFENDEDLQEFAKLIGQKLNSKTKSSWHPFKPHINKDKKNWVDES